MIVKTHYNLYIVQKTISIRKKLYLFYIKKVKNTIEKLNTIFRTFNLNETKIFNNNNYFPKNL